MTPNRQYNVGDGNHDGGLSHSNRDLDCGLVHGGKSRVPPLALSVATEPEGLTRTSSTASLVTGTASRREVLGRSLVRSAAAKQVAAK